VAWDRDGNLTLLPPLLGRSSQAYGVNAAGLAVGFDGGDNNAIKTFAVRWDRDGNPTELPRLHAGDETSQAFGINAAGKAVGISGNSPVVWDRDGNPTELPFPAGAGGAVVRGINDRGEAAGTAGGEGGAFWDRDGNLTLLPTLPGGVGNEVPEARFAAGNVINVHGEVVGISFGAGGGATVWDSDGNPTALPFLAGAFGNSAFGINAAGEIVGYSIGPSGFRAVVWRPTSSGAP
jgi:uncharacterized membrane protein